MSRLKHAEPILQAAEQWKQQCLLAGGSIFSTEQLWIGANFDTLQSCYVDKTVTTKGSFLDKVKEKIGPEPAHIKRLWAEMAWAYYLFPTNMKAETKRDRIISYWGWSGTNLEPDHGALSDSILKGIGSAGAAYHTYAWLEFRFFVTMLKDWFREATDQKESLLSDAWQFAHWLESREHVAARMFRHVILYLLFPDSFEPIATGIDKRQIVKVLHSKNESFDYKDRVVVDRAILDVREQLEAEHGSGEVNFYRSPVQELWQTAVAKSLAVPTIPLDSERVSDEGARAWFREKFPESARVWWLSAGIGGHLWAEFAERKVAVLSYGDLGDLSEYATREEMTADLVDLGRGPRPWNRSLALMQFSREMQINDVIIAQYGGLHVVGWGHVTGDYTYDPGNPEYPHRRSVEWHACDVPITAPQRTIAKALTDFSPYLPFVQQVFAKIDRQGDGEETTAVPEYTIETALEGLFVSRGQFHRILQSIRLRRHLVLQGPPGTGKTFIAQRIAWCLIGRKDSSQVSMVQFHQSYSYEDFIQGWRPNNEGGFSLRNGVFFEFCEHARAHPEEYFVFIIDQAEWSTSRGYPALPRGRHPVGRGHPPRGLSYPGANNRLEPGLAHHPP